MYMYIYICTRAHKRTRVHAHVHTKSLSFSPPPPPPPSVPRTRPIARRTIYTRHRTATDIVSTGGGTAATADTAATAVPHKAHNTITIRRV